jgi:hypothetical protein
MASMAVLHAGFLIALFFDPEDGGDIFIRNVFCLSVDYTMLYHNHLCESTSFFITY